MRRPVVLLLALSAAASFAADGPELPARALDVGQRAKVEAPRADLLQEAAGRDSSKRVGDSAAGRRGAEPIAKVKPPRVPEKGAPSVRPIESLAMVDQSIAVTVRVIPDAAGAPAVFALGQNQPNPSPGSTLIRYSLGIEASVAIEVFDLHGSRIATLVDGRRAAGQHTIQWNGLDQGGNAVRSGVYFYRMKADSFVKTKKLILQR